MKNLFKRITATTTLLLIAILSQAQFSVGVYSSMGISGIDLNGAGEFLGDLPETMISPTVGVAAEFQLTDHFMIQSGLEYRQKGFSVKETFNLNLIGLNLPVGAKAITRLHYIDMPILAKFQTAPGPVQFYAKAGPTIGYATKGVLDPKATLLVDFDLPNVDINLGSSLYNRWEVGAKAGIGVAFDTGGGQFQVESSYTHGLSNMFDNPILDVRMKNRSWQIGIGYMMRI